jgi:23S rRNA (adenine2503-C2)-methyltransferase
VNRRAPSSRSIHDFTLGELETAFIAAEVAPVHVRELWRALYCGGDVAIGQGKFPPPLQRWVAGNAPLFTEPSEQVSATASSDGLTRKFLLRLEDGQTVETVLMGYRGRHTVCVSTQAGCAMGCVFCATGQMGFVRHLRPSEIVAQVLHAQRALGEERLRNLVLMGMGEPLHNYDAVMTALEIIADPRGLGITPSRITISTVGVVPGILRLAEEDRPYGLAVSLHGATQAARAALVPVSQRWPLSELIAACRTYAERTGRRIFFEWTLIEGSNDSPEQARVLAELIAGIDAHVNLIPLNPTAKFGGVASSAATEFQAVLRRGGIPSTVRQRRGIDVAAGCGQLRAERTRFAPCVSFES